jgi:RNA ligase (TIGR02306 family)
MSKLEVRVYELEILPHPNADAIELAKVGDYLCIVRKGDFKTGDKGIYIPEQALVPKDILEEMGLVGALSGPEKNRVKAKKLRGIVSQGLIYPAYPVLQELARRSEDGDLAVAMGITKWEPPEASLPQQMRGRQVGVAQHITVNYDIENIKKHNTLFEEGEEVIVTEKIHGTFSQFGYIPKRLFEPYLHLGCFTVSSKGLGQRGILLDHRDQSNVYARIAEDKDLQLAAKLVCIKAECQDIIGDNPIYLLGEIFGPGIQKGFGYGVKEGEIEFRAFDIVFGERSKLQYLDAVRFGAMCNAYSIPCVPVIYRGPFRKADLPVWNSGKETISGKEKHIREGVVVRPIAEKTNVRSGRVILKSVSDAYLLRGGDTTEFN